MLQFIKIAFFFKIVLLAFFLFLGKTADAKPQDISVFGFCGEVKNVMWQLEGTVRTSSMSLDQVMEKYFSIIHGIGLSENEIDFRVSSAVYAYTQLLPYTTGLFPDLLTNDELDKFYAECVLSGAHTFHTH